MLGCSFHWNGGGKDSKGVWRRTGFDLHLPGVRISTFRVPTKKFGVWGRRFVMEMGRLHSTFTWKGEEDV